MSQVENLDLNRGHKEYDSKVKNLEGILVKVQKLFDVAKYQAELQQIQDDKNNDPSLSKKMGFANMQMDYEAFVLNAYNERLDALTKKVEDELVPFYELYLLTSKIDMQVAEVTGKNIGEIIQNARRLVDALNALNTHDKHEKNSLIDLAYRAIYSVILYEEIFERSDILTYINHLNIPANRENLGRLLEVDLQKLNESDFIDEDLRTIKTEGLGYDYLNEDIVRKVSRKTVGEKNSEYQERKRQVIAALSAKVKEFVTRKDELMMSLNNLNAEIKKLYLRRGLWSTRAISMVMIPIITFSAGRAIGKVTSNKITEYKTITRTINLSTGEIIGEPEEVFDENETTYVATVMECSPWRENPTGVGYIRNVTAYEYITPEDVSDDYHATIEDLTGNVLEKYSYVEPKDTLDEEDSTVDVTILITETYQDKSDSRQSTKYVIPFSIAGAGIGLVLDVALVLLGVYDFRRMRRMFEELSEEIKENRLSKQDIRDRLSKMKDEALQLQDEYNGVVRNYGALGDQFIISEIDTSWLIPKGRARSKKKDNN